jgi:hypothetical protein
MRAGSNCACTPEYESRDPLLELAIWVGKGTHRQNEGVKVNPGYCQVVPRETYRGNERRSAGHIVIRLVEVTG